MLVLDPEKKTVKVHRTRICPECKKEAEPFTMHCSKCHVTFEMLSKDHVCKVKHEDRLHS